MDDLRRRVRGFLAGGPGLWLAPGDGTPPPGCVVVATSGTTGGAKLVVLSRGALIAAAEMAAARLGAAATWHLALQPTYVAGLMVLVRGELGGGVRQASPSLDDLDPVAGPNAVSVVGTQLYRAVADPSRAARLARFDAVLVGGAALAPDLRQRAEAAGIRVIETYGMSETCGGVVWDGRPLDGVDVRLGERGRVTIAGPTVFDGYLGDPNATAAVLVDGAVLTRDRGRWDDGRLVIDGRLDDVVISGGVNVDLAEVRRAVATIDPGADVVAVPDDEWGSRVVLVAASGPLEQWRQRLRALVPSTSLPRQVLHVASLPLTPGGKPDRPALVELAQRTAGHG
jgi:O-succinylbenzoic acid--CoA ligase